MDEQPFIEESEPLLGTSTLRGLLLLGGVAAVAYIGYQVWRKSKATEGMALQQPRTIRVPVELPLPANKSANRK